MTALRTILALATLSSTCLQRNATAEEKAPPRFLDLRVPRPRLKRTTPANIGRPENETDAQFNKRIRDAGKGGPNFAGHFAIVGWSCGWICIAAAIVDVQTGTIYKTPFEAGVCDVKPGDDPKDLLNFRLDSRLLIVRGELEYEGRSGASCGTFYFEWDGRSLKLTRSIPAKTQGE
jgi:hypothetical protein